MIGAGYTTPPVTAPTKVGAVQPNGAGITHTITRAKLAAIAAANLLGYCCIATDSLCSLEQIRKQILYPELHHQHVKSHAGIAMNAQMPLPSIRPFRITIPQT
eukprot:1143749-Pelagomonas_calceolata.AAC.1